VRHAPARISVPALAAGAVTLVIATAVTQVPAGSGARAATAAATTARPIPAVSGHFDARVQGGPLSTSRCVTQLHIRCYSPLQYRAAYDLDPLYARGVTGAGRTIVVVDSFGSPTIQHDLQVFDAAWGLPDTTVDVVRAGAVPPFDPADKDMAGWAGETTLDVEYAHAIAPDARIVLAETPTAETEGVTGFPDMMEAEKRLVDADVPDVVSQSFDATENTFPGFDRGDFSSLLSLRGAFVDAAAHGVTVLAASGDDGAANARLDGSALFARPLDSWPSSDPLVTSVGGTRLTLDDSGRRLAPDAVWNDGYGAGGGGLSAVFRRPYFQNRVRGVVGARRGTPDLSATAAVDGGAWVYAGYQPAQEGWHVIGGTSEATPLFAGVVALADQAAGRRLGNLNPLLYTLGAGRRAGRNGIVDVTAGDNGFQGVAGYPAGPGYDLASGLGTFDGTKLVDALVDS